MFYIKTYLSGLLTGPLLPDAPFKSLCSTRPWFPEPIFGWKLFQVEILTHLEEFLGLFDFISRKIVYSPIWFLFWLWQRCVNPICSFICSVAFPPSLTSTTVELALFATSIVSFSRTKLTRKTHLSNEKKITSCSGYLYRGWNLGIILDHENIRIPIEQLFFFRGSLEQSVWKPPFDTNSEMD